VKAVAIIPARGGSKSVPRKNLRLLGGKPLLAWSIECGRACPSIDRVVVSTEDDEIASVAAEYEAEIVRRPRSLAEDETGDLPVYLHALSGLAGIGDADAIVWLRPTSPLRTVADVEGALELLAASGAITVRSISAAEHHPFWMKRLDGNRLVPFTNEGDEWRYPRRQDLPPAFRLNGAVDIVRPSSVSPDGPLFGRDAVGFVMPPERSIDIDSEVDFAVAEALLTPSPR
jgi:CMP-N,N'-diacetyllegionaminic acid synthase